jgi:peptide/nickel transport system substrate-binding protein
MDTSDIENLPEPKIVAELYPQSVFTRQHKILWLERLEDLMRSFSPGERLVLYVLSIATALATLILLAELNGAISVQIPARGGSYVEGVTGPARFINPILAVSEPDQDISQLVYSGLMRATPGGTYIPDLADGFTISPDGTTYTFRIKNDAVFHDGTPLKAADILYTISLAQNPDIKSPHRADWEGVTVSSPDENTVVFTLPHAYAPFIEDTTIGILPKHLWQNVQPDSFPFSQLNTRPIGSGPYKVTGVRTDATGAPTRYELSPFEDSVLNGSYISRISFAFFPNETALLKAYAMHQVDAVSGISPSQLHKFERDDQSVVVVPLPRIFGIFFNQNHNSVLSEIGVRTALENALDKQKIVNEVLNGYGAVLDGPIPPGILGSSDPASPTLLSTLVPKQISTSSVSDHIQLAHSDLKKAGWSLSSTTQLWTKKIPKSGSTPASTQTLTLKLATADEPELVATANLVAKQWRAAGVEVDVQIYPLSDFNNTVLRPRNYDAILFGEVVSRSGDLFAFWHSSQRNDPGLNLSLYTNSKADSLLSRARASNNKEERDSLNAQFVSIIQKDRPAIFLYSPDFIYIVPTKIRNIQVGALSSGSERFLNVYQWYTDTERVWNFFAQKFEILKK